MADLHVADSASQPPGRALTLPEETCMHPFAYDHPASRRRWEQRA